MTELNFLPFKLDTHQEKYNMSQVQNKDPVLKVNYTRYPKCAIFVVSMSVANPSQN